MPRNPVSRVTWRAVRSGGSGLVLPEDRLVACAPGWVAGWIDHRPAADALFAAESERGHPADHVEQDDTPSCA